MRPKPTSLETDRRGHALVEVDGKEHAFSGGFHMASTHYWIEIFIESVKPSENIDPVLF